MTQTNPDIVKNIISNIVGKESRKETTPRYVRLVDKSSGLVYELNRLWPQMGADGGKAQETVALESMRLWRDEVRLADMKGKLASGDGTVQERAKLQIEVSELEAKAKAGRRAVKASRAQCVPPPVECEVAGIFFLPAQKEDGLPARWEIHGQPFGAYFATGRAIMIEVAWENALVEQEWPLDQFYALLSERRAEETEDEEEEQEEDEEEEKSDAPEAEAKEEPSQAPDGAAEEDDADDDPFRAALANQLAAGDGEPK